MINWRSIHVGKYVSHMDPMAVNIYKAMSWPSDPCSVRNGKNHFQASVEVSFKGFVMATPQKKPV